jgi:uncharacterized protein YraI
MWQFWQFTSKGPGEAFGGEGLSMDMDRFNGTLNELMEFAGIRIPIVNLNEKFETLDEKVNTLEGIVSTIDPTGNAKSGIFSRVDNLEVQISNLGGSINTLTTTLTQRITAVEQSVANLGNTPSNSTPPTNTSSNSTTPTNSSSDSPAPTNTTSINDTYATCITSALNVRSGPGASYPMVAGLRYGQRVKVINRQNGWAQFENPVGWSSEAYLSFEQSISSVPIDSPQPATTPASYGICNTSGLNVRSGPGVTNTIVGGLTYGQRIKILTNKNGWVQIETPSGWCNASYLSFA